MPRPCKVCVWGISNKTEDAIAKGLTQEQTAARLGVTRAAIRSHLKHIKEEKLETVANNCANKPIAVELRNQANRLCEEITAAKAAGDGVMLIRNETQLLKTLEALAKLETAPDTQNNNTHTAPQIKALTGILLNALANYPDAKQALLEALEGQQLALNNGAQSMHG